MTADGAVDLHPTEENRAYMDKMDDSPYYKGLYKDIYKEVSSSGIAWDDNELISKPTKTVVNQADEKKGEKEEEGKDVKSGDEPQEEKLNTICKQVADVVNVGEKLLKFTVSDNTDLTTEDPKEGL